MYSRCLDRPAAQLANAISKEQVWSERKEKAAFYNGKCHMNFANLLEQNGISANTYGSPEYPNYPCSVTFDTSEQLSEQDIDALYAIAQEPSM